MPYSSIKNALENNTMILNGSGQVTAVPDLAVLRLGIQTTGENLTLIQSENARISQALLQALEGLNSSDIKTYQYSIHKVYEYENGKQIDKGYSVRNIFEIKTNNLDQVGEIIDTAVYYGANVVESVNFELSDSSPYYLEALNLAVKDAYEKAESISNTLNITINPIPKRILENSTVIPMAKTLNMRESSVTTPIEGGNILITAFVTVQFEY